MKKTVCFLLAALLALSLTGCAKTPESPTAPDEATIDGPTAADAETQVLPAEKPLTFSLPELPDVGEYYTGVKINYFFEDGLHGTFEPRDDYGPLSLYFADVTFYRDITSESEEWSFSEYMCSYGLMTRDGRVVTGANWTEAISLLMDDETGCFLLRKAIPGSEYGYDMTTDVIALDGSWAMHFDTDVSLTDLFRRDLPYLIIGTETTVPAVYSAKDGKPVLKLGGVMETDPDYGYTPPVIYADETLLLLQTEGELVEGRPMHNVYTALDWNGNVLYTKEMEDRDLYPYDTYLTNGKLLRQASLKENGKFRLLNAMCEPVSDAEYESLMFDDHTGYTLAVYGSGNEIRADYFDKDGNPVFPDTGWTPVALNNLDSYNFLSGTNGTVFCTRRTHMFRDFFGNEIELPVTAKYVTVLSDYEYGEITLYMRGEDGFGYLLTPDGKLLMKIDPPYEWQYSGGGDRYVSLETGFGRALAVYKDGTVRIFDLAAGEEICSTTLETLFGPGTDPETYHEKCSLWFLSGELLCARQTTDDRSAVYSTTDLLKKYNGVVQTRYENGLVLIATPAECIALDEDGHVLYRAGNGKMA